MTHKTFRVDNQLIQPGPFIFGPTYKKSRLQLWLPGLEPAFGPFDYWATIGLYSLLDPKNPGAPVTVKPTQLLRVLDFARVITEAKGEDGSYQSKVFPSQDYRLIEDTLNRLFTAEVRIDSVYKVRKPGQRGRPKNQLVQFRGRILQSYKKTWPPGVTPPDALPPRDQHKRKNINAAKDPTTGASGDPVWEFKKGQGPRPQAIEYRLASDLVRGLTGEDPHIGATILPLKIFSLRKDFQKSTAATNLLFWVCRQLAPKMTRKLEGLAEELNLDLSRPGRGQEAILKAFKLLKKSGVIVEFNFDPKTQTVSFEKESYWSLDEDATPALPATGDGA